MTRTKEKMMIASDWEKATLHLCKSALGHIGREAGSTTVGLFPIRLRLVDGAYHYAAWKRLDGD